MVMNPALVERALHGCWHTDYRLISFSLYLLFYDRSFTTFVAQPMEELLNAFLHMIYCCFFISQPIFFFIIICVPKHDWSRREINQVGLPWDWQVVCTVLTRLQAYDWKVQRRQGITVCRVNVVERHNETIISCVLLSKWASTQRQTKPNHQRLEAFHNATVCLALTLPLTLLLVWIVSVIFFFCFLLGKTKAQIFFFKKFCLYLGRHDHSWC